MKIHHVFILGILAITVFPIITYAADYEFPNRWQPLYDQCLNKLGTTLVTLETMDTREFPDEDLAELDMVIADVKIKMDTMCSCISSHASTAFDQRGVEISNFEIQLLAQSFRFEELYPDPNTREIFGQAVLPCVL